MTIAGVRENDVSIAVAPPRYAALIRAYQYTPLLVEVVESLRRQSAPPQSLVIVDSSGDPAVSALFSELATMVIPYPKEDFNFAKALNLGVAAIDQPLTLNISSHVVLLRPDLIAGGWAVAQAGGMDIVTWYPTRPGAPRERRVPVTPRTFNGRNGIANAMAMIPTALLRERGFREEVFAAEDQEWTKYYLAAHGRPVLRIEAEDVSYQNPNHIGKASEVKLLHEELAIGYYVNRRLLLPDRVIARFLRGVLAAIRRRPERARIHMRFAWELMKANFIRPKARSRYF
jgi:hypothetical protein